MSKGAPKFPATAGYTSASKSAAMESYCAVLKPPDGLVLSSIRMMRVPTDFTVAARIVVGEQEARFTLRFITAPTTGTPGVMLRRAPDAGARTSDPAPRSRAASALARRSRRRWKASSAVGRRTEGTATPGSRRGDGGPVTATIPDPVTE